MSIEVYLLTCKELKIALDKVRQRQRETALSLLHQSATGRRSMSFYLSHFI